MDSFQQFNTNQKFVAGDILTNFHNLVGKKSQTKLYDKERTASSGK
jgi:hypothetical protein